MQKNKNFFVKIILTKKGFACKICPVKYVFFDLDGTLCDSSAGIFACFRYSFEKMGLTPPTERELRACVGPPLLDSYLKFFGGDRERALLGVRLYRERYSVLGWKECRLYEGVEECLSAITAAGMKVGLATSKPQEFAERILNYFNLEKYFSVTVGSKLDNSFDGKAEILALGMKKLGATAKECCMVGDRKQDMDGAIKNAVFPIGIRVGFAEEGELEKAGAKLIAEDFKTLQNFLLKRED